MCGSFNNIERARQLLDFGGLKFGTIMPTDVDGLVEFGDVLFVLIEAKVTGCALPLGQKLALERVCNIIDGTQNRHGDKRTAVLLIAEHNTPLGQDVDLAQAQVSSLLYSGEWITPECPVTVRRAIEILLERHTERRYTKEANP